MSRPPLLLLALFPHPDAARRLNAERARLFASGWIGARSLPLAAPLARLASPPAPGELAAAAAAAAAGLGAAGGRWRLGPPRSGEIAGLPELPPCLLRPLLPPPALVLGVPLPDPAFAIASLGRDGSGRPAAAAAGGSAYGDGGDGSERGPFEFRPAYLAVLTLRPADSGRGFGFDWTIGRPYWLPALAADGRGRRLAAPKGDAP